MSLSSLSTHLTQALPTPLQNKLGLQTTAQNAPDHPSVDASTGLPSIGIQPGQMPEQPSEHPPSLLSRSLSNAKLKWQRLWPSHAQQAQAEASGIFTNADSQAAAAGGGEPSARSLGSNLENTLGHKLETQVGSKIEPKASKLWQSLKEKLHFKRPPHEQKPEQPGLPGEAPPHDAPTEQTPGEKPAQPQNSAVPGQPGQKPPLQRMEAPPGWKPGDPVVESPPWNKKIEPLNWDQLVERRKFGKYTRTPKYSLTPDQIRVNYQARQQESLEKLVYSMKWNDDDAINPFSEKLPTER